MGDPDRSAVPPLVIAGMGRSGTSATARLLHSAGLDLGDELMAPSESNRLGFYEDVRFYELNRALVAAGLGPEFEGRPRWAYADRIEPERLNGLRERGEALVGERAARGRPWGFKDPRATMLLDFYDRVAPGARYLFVYRAPWEVLDSLLRLEGRPLSGRAATLVRAWISYNSRVLGYLDRHPGRAALVHVDAVGSDPEGVLELAGRLLADAGAPALTRPAGPAVFDSGLLAKLPAGHPLAELLVADHPEAAAVYERLEERADLPGTAGVARPRAVPARSRGTGTVPLDVVYVGPVGGKPSPGDARQTVALEPGESPGEAANDGIVATDAERVAVLFEAHPRPGGLAAAVSALSDHSAAAVLLEATGAPGSGVSVEQEPVGTGALLERIDAFTGVVIERSAWLECGGFDRDLPRARHAAWALAVACMAGGMRVAVVSGAVEGGPPGAEEAERRRARRHVLERHGGLAARAFEEALTWSEALGEARRLVDERTAERDRALSVLTVTTGERDRAREAFEDREDALELARRCLEALSAERDDLTRRLEAVTAERDDVARRLDEVRATRAWSLANRWWRIRARLRRAP